MDGAPPGPELGGALRPVLYHEPIKATAPGRTRTRTKDRFVCARCGIEAACRSNRKTAYCEDCLPEARNLGWVPRDVQRPSTTTTTKTTTPDREERTAA